MDKKEKEIDKVTDAIERVASRMGMSDWDTNRTSTIPSSLGLCSTCQEFEYSETEFRVIWSKCGAFQRGPFRSAAESITKCSHYRKVGQMSLREMASMAHFIDIDKKKVGF